MATNAAPLLIKRYASRRLYNTETSDYVTLEDIAAFIRDGREVKIVDLKSGDDLTRQYLLQIIAHAEAMPVQIQHPSARVARITAGSDVYEQKGLEKPEDFPKGPELPKSKGVELGEDFLRSLTHAKASISKDDLKPPMTRACLDITSDNIHLAATRLVRCVPGSLLPGWLRLRCRLPFRTAIVNPQPSCLYKP